MSRYRKIEVRTWSDEKFRLLSPIPPSGQGLWFFLLTGPHTGPIPGLFRAGRAGMAEELGWDLEAFDKAFGEAFALGMVKADFKAKLIWLPKALAYNRPESPNVVKSWAAEWDGLPECDLKREAYDSICDLLKGFGDSYLRAFLDSCRKPLPKPSAKAMPNQEQEQEQEQEEKHFAPSPADAASTPAPETQGVSHAEQAPAPRIPIPEPVITLPTNTGEAWPVYREMIDDWQALYPAVDVEQALRSMRGWCDAKPANRKTKSGMKSFITNWLNREQNKAPTVQRHSADGRIAAKNFQEGVSPDGRF